MPRSIKLFFWGQFTEGEYSMPFCSAWRRELGEVEHFSYREVVSRVGHKKAIEIGINKIKEFAPSFVINWQGNEFDKKASKTIRRVCDDIGAKFIFISLDDPFYLHNWKGEPYRHVHSAITCCSEAREIYNEHGIKDVIFAPPPCSTDYHIAENLESAPANNGVFYFFTNPYIGDIYKKYGAMNRFDIIKEMLAKKICVGIASFEQLRTHKGLSESDWTQIKWQGFVPYEEFQRYRSWALHFNSSVVGRGYTYLNQRVFEILGIGGVQMLDVSDRLRNMFEKLCAEAKVEVADMPFLFYTTPNECAVLAEKYLADPEMQKRKQEAARKIQGLWTFEHLVRRIALDEKTFFDRY